MRTSIKEIVTMPIKNIIWLKRMASRGGHPVAEKRLLEYANRLGVTANRRLNVLEKHNKTLYAYDLAQSYTSIAYDNNRYKEDIVDFNEAYEQILSARKFLQKSTSTLKGYMEVENKRIQAFREIMQLPSTYTKKEVSEILKFLGEKPIRKLIAEHYHGSEEIVDAFREKVSDDPSAKDEILELVKAYQRTKEGGELIPENERLYYDELSKYLKGELKLSIKRGRVIRNASNKNR